MRLLVPHLPLPSHSNQDVVLLTALVGDPAAYGGVPFATALNTMGDSPDTLLATLSTRPGFGAEEQPSDVDADGLTDDLELVVGTSAELPDTDGDGMRDGEEVACGRDPLVADPPSPSMSGSSSVSATPSPPAPSCAFGPCPLWAQAGYDSANTGRSRLRGPGSVSPGFAFVWSAYLASTYAGTAPPGRVSPVVTADGTVCAGASGYHSASYFLFVRRVSDYRVSCVGVDGVLLWAFRMDEGVSCLALGPRGEVLVASGDRNLYALSPNNGTLLWRFTSAGPLSRSSPTVGPGGVVYVGDKSLYALAPNGTLLWSLATLGFVSGTAAVGANGMVVFRSGDGLLYAASSAGVCRKCA